MRVARIVNAIPNDHSNETNSDSEPNIAVNPSNPLEMAITAFTPPDSGDINSPIYFSSDGGENWSFLFDVAGDGSLDQTISFASTANDLFMATIRSDSSPLAFDIDTSTSPTAGVTFASLDTVKNVDQPWVHAISVPSGADSGKIRTYVGFGDTSSGYQAAVVYCLDAQAASPSFTTVELESRTALRNGFHIRPAPHGDGTVYCGYQSWQSQSGSVVTMNMVVARDDNWGRNSFGDLKDTSDNKAGRIIASVKINEDMSGHTLGGNRPDNGFDVQVDPNNSDIVYISWIDDSGPGFTLRVRRSLNRGVDWSGDLITVDNAALATLAINSQGTVALAYLELVSGQWETHFRTTTDGTTWDDTLLARTASTGGFIGDYMRMIAVGPHFYGVFPAMNTPTAANFFPNGGGTLRYQRNLSGGSLVGTDGVTPVSASLDPFFFKVQEFDTTVITDRNTFGKDEVDALLHTSSTGTITAAFLVTVDGFTANDLGITAATFSGTPNVAPTITLTPENNPPIQGMMAVPTACNADDESNLTLPQRFTWTFNMVFTNDGDFTSEDRSITLTASVTSSGGITVPGSAPITLTEQPDPYETDGPTSWLSVDLQVFTLAQNGSLASTPGIALTGTPNDFIHRLLANTGGGYNDPTLARAPNHPFDLDLVAHEDTSSVELATRIGAFPPFFPGIAVFNFAVARVRYRALTTPAPNVRVFFRLFQASTTATFFEPSTTYPTGGTGTTKVPLLGVVGGEVVTIPFFAAPRVDPTNSQGLNAQTDPDNVGPVGESIPPDSTGNEVQVYFGCWLDINQTNATLPASPTSSAGPFTPTQTIQQAIRGKHQCLVAEINLDPPEPQIPVGISPANSDKLAQRNLEIVGTASPHLIPQTFDIKPTAATLAPNATPDEILFDWGKVPAGTRASIYLPGTSADTILSLADRLYELHSLSRLDANTIGCPAHGLTYMPVPPGIGANFAGLLTLDLPATVKRGTTYTVVTRQITNASARLLEPPPPAPLPPVIQAASTATAIASPAETNLLRWRRVLGAFQLSIPVSTREKLLGPEERLLSVMKWIARSIPIANRWYPVFQRYLEVLGGRVKALGGDPNIIIPSPEGYEPSRKHHGKHEPPFGGGARHGFTGKVIGVRYDRFGDFEGFTILTEEGHEHSFRGREEDVEELVRKAWEERMLITVFVEAHKPEWPASIVLRRPPKRFEH